MSTLDRINDTEFAGQTSETVGGFFVQDDGGKILINRFQEEGEVAKLLFDATDSSGTNDGVHIATENAGDRLILNGTDASSTDANDKVLGEDETGSGDILLDGTDSSSTDAGHNIIKKKQDFSNKNVTIKTQVVQGSIVKQTLLRLQFSTLTQTDLGSYVNIQSLMGEDLNRIQESYYYQDYSYEKVGVSLAIIERVTEYVHSTGFRPFGKVSIASRISVIKTTATDVRLYR